MDVRWGNLADVVVVSLGVTVAVVVLFSLGVAAWSRSGTAGVRHGSPRTGQERLATVVAVLCFGVCLAIAGYGIRIIVPG
jgi:hypothetical protein